MRDSGFVTATVTGERYADMLQNRIIPSLADKYLLERTIFMQDGAPPQIARRLKDLLRRSFGDDRVLSRHFHHAWPPRSPDLSPCLLHSVCQPGAITLVCGVRIHIPILKNIIFHRQSIN
ncbi:uncharacterized protein TNCV_2446131 [Trichonephila clavipes]|nr:uncharacterized protein TNCV_2446131 [Trichonephila clavipes]